MNAYTSREVTSYHMHLLKDDLSLALDVLSDIVQHSIMPADEIERERGVILQEIGMCFDTPDDIIFDNYYETAYAKQALGAPILGTNEIIKSMTRETLMDYVQNLYTPSNIVICASGNLDHDAFVKDVEAKFNALPSDQAQNKVAANPTGGEHRENRQLEQSHIILGFDAPSHVDENYYTSKVLCTLFGGGMSSRLFQEIRERRGLVYSVYSFHSAHSDCGQFGIYAGTGPNSLPELVPVMCDEIKKLSHTLDNKEIERAKAQLRASSLMSRESMLSRADQNAKSVLLRGYVRSPDEIIEQINNVNKENLCQTAEKIFSSEPTLAALGPLNQLATFDEIKGLLAA